MSDYRIDWPKLVLWVVLGLLCLIFWGLVLALVGAFL